MAEALWAGVAAAYERSFATLCAGAVPAMLDDLPSGSRLLDVGCGTGALVAEARSRGHAAIGVEPDRDMAAIAGDRLGEVVRVGGLPDLPFADDGFDAVTASFVLNHVDDPRAAARELARVAAPGATVRATVWGSTPPPQAVMWAGLLEACGAVPAPSPRLPEGKDFRRSPDGLAGILSEAGLAVAEAGTRRWTWQVDPGDLWEGLTTVGGFGVAWRAQTDDVHDRARTAYDALGAPWRSRADASEPFAFDVECVLVEARVPRS